MEFYLQEIIDAELKLEKEQQNYLDLQVSDRALQEQLLRMQEMEHRRIELERKIVTALKQLSDQKLREIFGKLHQPEGASAKASAENFLHQVRETVYSPSTDLINPDYFGVLGLGQILDVYGEALGPELCRQLMESPIPPLVTSPDFRGDMSWRPHQAAVDSLINRYTKGPDALQNQRNLELLTKVGDALETMEPKLRTQLHSAYRSGPRSTYLSSEDDDYVQSRRHQARKQHGLTLLGDGRFNQLVRHRQFNNGDPNFELRTDEFTRPLTEEDRQELRRLSADPDSGLSLDTAQALKSIGENMDKLDYATTGSVYMSAEQFPLFRPTREDMLFFPAEQTTKHYGFGALLAQ